MEWVSNEEARSKEKLEGKKAIIEAKRGRKISRQTRGPISMMPVVLIPIQTSV